MYNVSFLTGAAGTVPINQLPMNLPAAELRGGKGKRETFSVCTCHSTAPVCKLNALTMVKSSVPGFLESERLPVTFTCCLQPTPQTESKCALPLVWQYREPHRY